jgi:hypothetical protein
MAAGPAPLDVVGVMHTCPICNAAIDGPRLTESETGSVFHPACVAQQLPADLVAALVAFAAAVAVPTALLWAG